MGDHTPLATDPLLVDIVQALKKEGVDPETYTLYEYVDPDALTEVINSADASLEIQLTIEGVQLEITQDGAHART